MKPRRWMGTAWILAVGLCVQSGLLEALIPPPTAGARQVSRTKPPPPPKPKPRVHGALPS